MNGEAWTEDQLRTEFSPRDRPELEATARAVIDHRQQEADRAVFAELTDFERELMRRAFNAGMEAATSSVRKVVGAAAVTVDAGRVLEAISSPKQLDTRPPETFPGVGGGPWFKDDRAVRIAGAAREYVDDWPYEARKTTP